MAIIVVECHICRNKQEEDRYITMLLGQGWTAADNMGQTETLGEMGYPEAVIPNRHFSLDWAGALGLTWA